MDPDIFKRMSLMEEQHWWFHARRTIIEGIIARLRLPKYACILDAGCGTGGNLAMLSGFGDVLGMEMNDQAREIAVTKGISPVVPGGLPDALPFDEPRFDLVALLDVLEHVADDEAALNSLGRLLKPNGHLLITVPAFPFLWGRHDEAHHHYRRYRLQELESRVKKAGMDVAYSTYFNTLLFPLIATLRLFDRIRPGRGSDDLAMPPKWINQMLYAIFSSERVLLERFSLPFGVSAMVVAKKGA